MTKVDIKEIESAYKIKFRTKKINKKTKIWKGFYNSYRKEAKKGYREEGVKSKPWIWEEKPEKKPRKISTSMVFNGKRYDRANEYYSTKENAKRAQKRWKDTKRKAILDKRKAGWFIWVGK